MTGDAIARSRKRTWEARSFGIRGGGQTRIDVIGGGATRACETEIPVDVDEAELQA